MADAETYKLTCWQCNRAVTIEAGPGDTPEVRACPHCKTALLLMWRYHGKLPPHLQAVLDQIVDTGTPAPSVVPLSDGFQVEWHCHGRHLEIEFPMDAEPTFCYYEGSNYFGGDEPDFEIEGPVAGRIEEIRSLLATLSKPDA